MIHSEVSQLRAPVFSTLQPWPRKNAYTPVLPVLAETGCRAAQHGASRCVFENAVPRCEKMDLLHPSIDLTLEPNASRSRELLEHRFTESGRQTAGSSCFQSVGASDGHRCSD